MNEPIVYKRSLLMGQLALAQVMTAPLIAVGMLYGLLLFYGVPFDRDFRILAVMLVILVPSVLRRPRFEALAILPQTWSIATSVVLRWLLLLAILIAIGYVTKTSSEFSRRVILTWSVVTPLPIILVSVILNEWIRQFMNSPRNARVAVMAGFNDVSRPLVARVGGNPEFGLAVKGYFDDRSAERLGLPQGSVLLGGLTELADYVNKNQVDVIFIALPMRQVQRVMDLLEDLRDTTASIYFVPDVFVMDLIQARTTELSGVPVVAMCETPFQGPSGLLKRSMDLALSLLALILLSPFLLLVAVLVKLSSPGPVIFRQRRYGLDGRIIDVYKFRTMTVTEDGPVVQQVTRDDDRVTPIGRLLRRYSIDELPQLLNVVWGDMSLVGPRPHAVAHNELYRRLIKGYMVRHKVPPGITGLAQVNGCRGETSRLEDMQRRIEYDLEYLRHWSPTLDLRILFQTLLQVIGDRKAY
jgi:putative colanic acid biosynthesis UDP-glucose lipid carrier transferase